MDLTLFKEGFFVMVIGMGTVFVFLTIMICAMDISSYILKFASKYFPEEIPVDKTSQKKTLSNNDAEVALAIACAINQAGKI